MRCPRCREPLRVHAFPHPETWDAIWSAWCGCYVAAGGTDERVIRARYRWLALLRWWVASGVVQIRFEPRDVWVGVYWTCRPLNTAESEWETLIYVCVVPMLPVTLRLASRRAGRKG